MYRGGFIFALVVGFICSINTVTKKGECYKNNIPLKETKKRNALLNLFPAYQIYHGFKKISKGNYKHDRQFKVTHAGDRGDEMARRYLSGIQ